MTSTCSDGMCGAYDCRTCRGDDAETDEELPLLSELAPSERYALYLEERWNQTFGQWLQERWQ